MTTYHDYGINWIWYLDATINDDNTITINAHYRIHKGDSGHPKTTKGFSLIEDDKRTVTHVKIDAGEYIVKNPRYIFDYKHTEHKE